VIAAASERPDYVVSGIPTPSYVFGAGCTGGTGLPVEPEMDRPLLSH
jgi:hypothetical protein